MDKQLLIDAFKLAVKFSQSRTQMYADLGQASIQMCFNDRIVVKAIDSQIPRYEIQYKLLSDEIDKDTFDELNKMVKDKEKAIDAKEADMAIRKCEEEIIKFLGSNGKYTTN